MSDPDLIQKLVEKSESVLRCSVNLMLMDRFEDAKDSLTRFEEYMKILTEVYHWIP